jgi:shikimate dehydrogenase
MRIDGHTRLAFVLGHPVSHSLSPAMHRAALQAIGLNAAYLPWAVPPERLAAAVQGLRAMGNLLGANVTVPHKEAIVPFLDSLTPEADAMGAVNTLIPRDGALVGDNTDGAGFLAALRQDLRCQARGITAAILGAGGSARAIALCLARSGARRLFLLNRHPERSARLAELVQARHPSCRVTAQALFPEWHTDLAPDLQLVVNTTSVGLQATDPPLFLYASLSPPVIVCDLIYNPPETPLLAVARARGCLATNGLAMLVHQGALAFERWTGRPAPVDAMREAVGIGRAGDFP